VSLTTSIIAAVPNPGPAEPPGAGAHTTTALSWLMWIATIILFGAAIVAGAMLAVEGHRGGGMGGQATHRLVGVIAGCIVLACSAQVINALV
jgi:hypothetical protein